MTEAESVTNFLRDIARVSDATVSVVVEDQGIEDMDDLIALSDDDVVQLCLMSGVLVRDKNRLLSALRTLRETVASAAAAAAAANKSNQRDDGGDDDTDDVQTAQVKVGVPTHFAIILEAASPLVVGRLAEATAGLVMATDFVRNVRELLTIPAERSAGAIPFHGAPFHPRIIRHRDGSYESVVVEVCDADSCPSIVMRIVGEEVVVDHRTTASNQQPQQQQQRVTVVPHAWPKGFDHTKLMDPEKIRVVCKQDASLEKCDLHSPVLHLFLLQLLGGTNKALPKMRLEHVHAKLRDMEKQIVVNERDTMFDKVREFVEPFGFAKKFDEVVHQGALLWGPAGGAKTTVARLVAECGFVVAFDGNLIALGNEFQNSASKGMINLFAFCRHHRHIPMLLLCDEIDRVVQKRDQFSSKKGGGGNEQENALSMLLALLTDKINQNIFMIGTTNKYHAIDEAAIRPGRIGLHIFVGRLSPTSAKEYICQLLQRAGFTNAVQELRPKELSQAFVRMIFNLTGAVISHAVKATVLIDRPSQSVSWATLEPLLEKRITELRNPAVDPSSLVLTATKQHLTLFGAAKSIRRAILRVDVAPKTKLPILRSTFLLNSATGEGFVAGNNHHFHVPLRIREVIPDVLEPQPIRQAAVFSDAVGTICAGLDAVSVDVVNLSNLPEVDEIPAFAHQQGKMGEAGLRIVAIHMDNIVGVKIDRSEGTTQGTTEGEENNFSVAKNVTDTQSEGTSATTETGFGTDTSKNVSTTVGWSNSSGSSTEKGWFWDTDSVNSSSSSHRDTATGSNYGFNQHKSWSEARTKDRSRAIGITTTTGGSSNTSRSSDRSITNNYSLEDPMTFRRVVNLIQELQHTPNVVVVVVSGRRDSFTIKLMVQELAIEPPMVCAICHECFHDPTRILMGLDAVPCCTYCFDHASHRLGIEFDDGSAYAQVFAVMRELQPVLPLVQAVECCAVEGLLDTQRKQTVLRTLAEQTTQNCPNTSRFVYHGFGNFVPSNVGNGACEVQRIPPMQLVNGLEPEKLAPHLLATGKSEAEARQLLSGSIAVLPPSAARAPPAAPSTPSAATTTPTPTANAPAPAASNASTPPTAFSGATQSMWAVLVASLASTTTIRGPTAKFLRDEVAAALAARQEGPLQLPDVQGKLNVLASSVLPRDWASAGVIRVILEAIVAQSTSEDPVNNALWTSALRSTASMECGACFSKSTTTQITVTITPNPQQQLQAFLASEQPLPTCVCGKCRKTSEDTTGRIDGTRLPLVLVVTIVRQGNNSSGGAAQPYGASMTVFDATATYDLIGVEVSGACYLNATGAFGGWKKLAKDPTTNVMTLQPVASPSEYLNQTTAATALVYRLKRRT